MYQIGEITYFRGNEITITSEPYTLYGGSFQDGIDENGKIWSLTTPSQKSKDAETSRREWTNQQNQFRRLRK